MFKLGRMLLVFGSVTLMTISQVAMAQAGGPSVSVNGVKIQAKQLEDWVKNAVNNGAKDSPELRQSILNELVVREAVLQDVKKTGLATRGDNDFKVKVAQQNVLMDLWFADYFQKHPIKESDLRADYERQANLTKEGRNSNEYKVSQIFVASEKEAEDLIVRINSGASFETVAREKSLDKASAASGGAVNWALPDQMMAPIGDAVVALTKGKMTSKPVKSQNGWHIVRLDDVRRFKLPAFEDVKQNIAQGMIQKQRQEAVAELVKKSNITQGK